MNRYSSRQLAAALVAASLLLAHAQAETIISTLPSDADVGTFGEALPNDLPKAATIGQTITVPLGDNVLTSFRFAVDDLAFVGETEINPVRFDAYVSTWDGEKASGLPLFSAGPFATTNSAGDDGFGREIFLIDTGELELIPGAQYIMFFSASNRFDGIHDGANLGATTNDPYPGGEIFSAQNGSDFGALMTAPWVGFGGHPFDLAFTATFVPEPSSLALMLAALPLAYLAYRRR